MDAPKDLPYYRKIQFYNFDRDTMLELAKLELELAIAETHSQSESCALATAQANERIARMSVDAAPKEVISAKKPSVNWKDAPPWANYHTFDGGGAGEWWENYPKIEIFQWRDTARGKFQKSDYTLPLGHDWRQSLTSKS